MAIKPSGVGKCASNSVVVVGILFIYKRAVVIPA